MQISKNKLDKGLENEMFRQFWYYLGKINNSQKSFEFFSDFLSEIERTVFAKRFLTAILITRGKNSLEIKNAIHVSNSTISSVSSWIKHARPETQKILKSISTDKNIENISDKIDDLLDKLPPKIYSNWKEKYEERNKRSYQRLTRRKLR